MRWVLLMTGLSAIGPTGSWAQSSAAACRSVADAAEVIMLERQIGTRMSVMADAATAMAATAPHLAALVEEAYRAPRGETVPERHSAVAAFRADAEASCIARL